MHVHMYLVHMHVCSHTYTCMQIYTYTAHSHHGELYQSFSVDYLWMVGLWNTFIF